MHRGVLFAGTSSWRKVGLDPVERLASKLIAAFEPLKGELVLEQLAVPEDLDDPEGEIDLWLASEKTYAIEEIIAVVVGSACQPHNRARVECVGSERALPGGVARIGAVR